MHALCQHLITAVILAQEPARPVLERLDPFRRVAVLMAILALVIIWLAVVAGVMIGAHWVRRLARQKPRSHELGDSASRLANQRLRESLEEVLPNVDTKSTVQIDRSTSETQVDRQTDA